MRDNSRQAGEESSSIDAHDLSPGFQFGSYVVQSCIGRGATARVYRAQHSALHKLVALKVMERALLERAEGSRRFLREGQTAAAIKHPNVVDITDVGVWNDLPYLVMELLEGEDLENYLARHGRLSQAELAEFMLPVIAGLAAAHDSGVVHRDLKPGNIFLARNSQGEAQPKIVDFGISKLPALDDLELDVTPRGELMGSPRYMAPEGVQGARDLTPQSDQYSLGVILYECITGRPPFDSDALLTLLGAIACGNFRPPREYRSDISPALERAILRAMSLKPEHRFDDVRQLGQALWPMAEGRTRLLWSPSFGSAQAEPEHTTFSPASHSTSAGIARPDRPGLRPRWGWRHASLVAVVTVVFGTVALMAETNPASAPASAGSAESSVALPAISGVTSGVTRPEQRARTAVGASSPPIAGVESGRASPERAAHGPAPDLPAVSIPRGNPLRTRRPASRQPLAAPEPVPPRGVLQAAPAAPAAPPAALPARPMLGVNDSPILD
jgi:eukaryotic-like serine/threonine-protein kinase